jgi:transposase
MDSLERSNAMPKSEKDKMADLFKQGYNPKEVAEMTGKTLNTIYKYRKLWQQAQYDGAIKDIQKNLASYLANSLKWHLEGLNKIARIANEEDYIRSQNSRDLAELHKQLEHWTISILSASNTLNQIAEYQETIIEPTKTKKRIPELPSRNKS